MRTLLTILATVLLGCSTDLPWTPVQDLDTEALSADGRAISWREHLVDDERTADVPLRGASMVTVGHLDGDDRLDVLSVHTDSRYLRVAYSTEEPFERLLLTLAELEDATALFDVAVGDVNGDDWPDVLALGEKGLLYLQNPAQSKPGFRWPRVYPAVAEGEWLSLEVVDLNGDGAPEIIGLRPFKIGDFPTIMRLTPGEDALSGEDWTAERVFSDEHAAFAVPGDLDGDGDLDLFVGLGSVPGLVWYRNVSSGSRIAFQRQAVGVDGFSGSVHSPVLADLDGDSRLDVAAAMETGLILTIVREQSDRAPWRARTIGDLGPDGVAAVAAADIDGDGDNDIIAGSQGPGPSEQDRERDAEEVNAGTSAGRIAWFQSPGGGTGAWTRHDLVRRERGRFDGFLALDVDQDEDLDFFGVRSDSGPLDGVFLLQQLHSDDAVVRFQPARSSARESLALPLP